MADSAAVIELASKQGGFVLRSQLYEFESRQTVWRKIKRREYVDVSDEVVRVIHLDGLDPLVRGAALCLPGAVVSHHAAAAFHSFPRLRDTPEVTVPSHCTHRFDGVVVHRTDDLSRRSIMSVKGLPVTTPARTVFDLASFLPFPFLDDIVEELLVAKKVAFDDLEAVVRAVGRRGKPGTTAMREILQKRGRGDRFPASVLEKRGLAILQSSPEIPAATPQFPIPWAAQKRFDIAFPKHRVAVEWDSRRWHAALDSMESDRRRDRECVAHGWAMLRFTWTDVTERQLEVISTVLGVLRSRPPGI